MTDCFYLNTLTQLGAPELTPVLCAVDDILYEGVSPELTWRRTTLLSTGGERCDFRFERSPPQDPTSA
jgi:predicted ArsR family transcriptional regulator